MVGIEIVQRQPQRTGAGLLRMLDRAFAFTLPKRDGERVVVRGLVLQRIEGADLQLAIGGQAGACFFTADWRPTAPRAPAEIDDRAQSGACCEALQDPRQSFVDADDGDEGPDADAEQQRKPHAKRALPREPAPGKGGLTGELVKGVLMLHAGRGRP